MSSSVTTWEEAGNVHLDLDTRLPPLTRHIAVAELAAKHSHGPKFLDIGCGRGDIPSLYRKLCPDAEINLADAYQVCLDSAEAKVGGAVRRYLISEAKFDILDVIEERFDVITLSHVLEHLLNPVQGMQDLMQMLNPGGVLVVAVPNPARPVVVLGNLWKRHYVNRGHVVAWDPSHFKNFLEKILGLDVVEYASDDVWPFRGKLGMKAAKIIPWWGTSVIAAIRKAS